MGLWDRDSVSVEAIISMALDTLLSKVDNNFFLMYIDFNTEDKIEISIEISNTMCFPRCCKCNVIGLETCCRVLLSWEKVSWGLLSP